MTFIKRYVAGAHDILSVRFTCNNEKCGATVSVKPTLVNETPYYRCPNCKAEWFKSGSEDLKSVYGLMGGLENIVKRSSEWPCKIQLEFDEQSNDEKSK